MQPLVACVLLTADRPAMTERAVKSFLGQTYQRKALLVFDNSKGLIVDSGIRQGIAYAEASQFRGQSIGALRNAANELASVADIIAHWDSDDWSHPYRLAEQVNLLQAARADAVGYNDMLFWKRLGADVSRESWLYRYTPEREAGRYALGTSLLYWRRVWEKNRFEEVNAGEDRGFVQRVRCVSTSGLGCQPRMIAEIHGTNTVQRPDIITGDNFSRVPEWDSYCRERMSL
jgi:glycosyltransferase involved in cell wall biosynthesis